MLKLFVCIEKHLTAKDVSTLSNYVLFVTNEDNFKFKPWIILFKFLVKICTLKKVAIVCAEDKIRLKFILFPTLKFINIL